MVKEGISDKISVFVRTILFGVTGYAGYRLWNDLGDFVLAVLIYIVAAMIFIGIFVHEK